MNFQSKLELIEFIQSIEPTQIKDTSTMYEQQLAFNIEDYPMKRSKHNRTKEFPRLFIEEPLKPSSSIENTKTQVGQQLQEYQISASNQLQDTSSQITSNQHLGSNMVMTKETRELFVQFSNHNINIPKIKSKIAQHQKQQQNQQQIKLTINQYLEEGDEY